MIYLSSTFTPAMLKAGVEAIVRECSLDDIKTESGAVSIVSHENTAQVFTALLGRKITFNRVNVSLENGDDIFCIIPQFRTTEAREFSKEEIEKAKIRCFWVRIKKEE